MVYYSDGKITVRDLEERDPEIFAAAEREQGWQEDGSKLRKRLSDAASGRAVCLAADFCGEPAGYVCVYPKYEHGAFAGRMPMIVNFAVLVKFRRRGVGGKLMDVAEDIAGQFADEVGLGVGLHPGYGSAQRLYAKRGYVPDGSGVWYRDKVCGEYENCCNDDDLVIYLSKKLGGRGDPPQG